MKKSQLKQIIKEKLLKEIGDNTLDWRVQDIIKMNKSHERVMRAVSTLDRAVKRLEKVGKENKGKPNANMFSTEVNNMRIAIDNFLLNPNSKFGNSLKDYEKGGRAAFGGNWDY